MMKESLEAFGRLLEIMNELREKCPWDREQTFDSLRNLTIEETYELADSIMEKDFNNIRKELGDLLLHIVFYAKIGEEESYFNIKDVIDSLCDKLIYRHPHVFGDTDVKGNSDIVKKNWEELKQKERKSKTGVLSGVPKSLPALVKANRVQEKVKAVGFDWEQRDQVWDKVEEELSELKHEIASGNTDKMEAEFGDLMFSVVNAARLYEIDPETALERTNRKFIKRFNYLEKRVAELEKDMKKMSLAEMDEIWNEAKKSD